MNKTLLFCIAIVLSTNVARSQSEVTFYTNMGDFVVETYDTLQPWTTANFLHLVDIEFYDGIIFHRVIDGFMIQGGDPTGTGSGGSGTTIPDEFDPMTSNVQKTISMANSGPNTGTSQFFINLVNNTNLDPNYPVFGIVTSNFSVVQSIGIVATDANDKPLVDVIMDSVRVTGYLGVEELSNQALSINVYPNPTKDHITIDISDLNVSGTDYLLKITDVLGQTVYSEQLTEQFTTIDISSITQKGIYFVNVFNKETNSIAVEMIVVE